MSVKPQNQKGSLVQLVTTPTISIGCDRDHWINEYVSAGFSLFGLRKNLPAEKGWVKTEYDPLLEPADLPRNYGVVLRPTDIVIDADPRNFVQRFEGELINGKGIPIKKAKEVYEYLKEGETDNPLIRLIKDMGLVKNSDTFIIQSGGGGLHLYYSKPANVNLRSMHENYLGIDFKRLGHYVVGPGCVHHKTKRIYAVLQGHPSQLQPVSDKLLALLEYEAPQDDVVKFEDVLDDADAKRRFKAFLQATPAAIFGERGDETTFKTAAIGKDMGLSLGVVYEMMDTYFNPKCQPMWTPDELMEKVRNGYNYTKGTLGNAHPSVDFKDIDFNDDINTEAEEAIRDLEKSYWQWDNDENGKPKSNVLGNTISYFLTPSFGSHINPLYRLLRFNQFSNQIEFTRRAPWHSPTANPTTWTDTDAIQLKYYLSQKKAYRTSTLLCHEAAIALSTTLYAYHPVKIYLDSLTWDGVSRLDNFLPEYTGAKDTPLNRALGRKTLLAAVYRTMEPGCQFDHILILEGVQGSGKSSLVRVLGGEFYKDISIDPRNKDTIDGMQGAWLIEASEMEFFARGYEAKVYKSFITRTIDHVRPAYGRTTQVFPRSCIFIGTINPEQTGYFIDSTGNRRYWPVSTNRINLDKLKADRDQLWAEAYARYKNKEPYHLFEPDLIRAVMAEQKKRMTTDVWDSVIEDWLRDCNDKGILPDELTIADIAQSALDIRIKDVDFKTVKRIAVIMDKMGYSIKKVNKYRLSSSSYVKRPDDMSWL